DSSLMYAAAVSLTLPFSTLSSRLELEAAALTTSPTFLLNLSWATATFCQTSLCDLERFAASFSSLVATAFSELANEAFTSLPRLFHRPDSTQNAAIGIFPEFGGTIK